MYKGKYPTRIAAVWIAHRVVDGKRISIACVKTNAGTVYELKPQALNGHLPQLGVEVELYLRREERGSHA